MTAAKQDGGLAGFQPVVAKTRAHLSMLYAFHFCALEIFGQRKATVLDVKKALGTAPGVYQLVKGAYTLAPVTDPEKMNLKTMWNTFETGLDLGAP